MNTDRTHPSYGLVQFTRVKATGTRLFDSPLEQHMHVVRVRVSGARVVDRGEDGEGGYMPEKGIVEFDMSAAQFAAAITTMNVFHGTPCTITRIGGEQIPEPPRDLNRADAVKDAAERRVCEADKALLDAMRNLQQKLANSSFTEDEQIDIYRSLHAFHRAAIEGIPWMAQRMRDEMQWVVTAAKREVDAAVTLMIHRAGIAALQSGAVPEALPALPVSGQVAEDAADAEELEEARKEFQW